MGRGMAGEAIPGRVSPATSRPVEALLPYDRAAASPQRPERMPSSSPRPVRPARGRRWVAALVAVAGGACGGPPPPPPPPPIDAEQIALRLEATTRLEEPI